MKRIGKKQALANLLFNKFSFLFEPVLLRLRNSCVVVLAYHRIYPDLRDEYLYDDEIISASPEAFHLQLRLIKDNFEVINFYQLRDMLSKKIKIPSNTLIITFDDGYADNYDIASNILSSYNMTAVFYVTTGYVEKAEPLWFEELFFLVSHMKRDVLVFKETGLK